MTRPPTLEELRRDLRALGGHEVVLHGSALGDHFTPRSDVDVAVVTRDGSEARNRALWLRLLGSVPDRYDVRVFELLPLPVQVEIAKRHRVVFGDPVELSYLFYHALRRWKDEGPRIRANRFQSLREKREALIRARGGAEAGGSTRVK